MGPTRVFIKDPCAFGLPVECWWGLLYGPLHGTSFIVSMYWDPG